LAAVNLSICFCAALFVVKMPPTTSQSVVVDDEVLDDEAGGAVVVVVVVEVSTDATTGFGGVVWEGVVAFGGSVGSVRTGAATESKVVVGELLLAAAHADIARAKDNALARKSFDFGIGTPRGNRESSPYAA
jgi:hypothetical protein